MGSIRIAAVLIAVTTLAAACSGDGPGGGPGDAGGVLPDVRLVSIERFDSCDELRGWARDQLAPRVGAYGFESPELFATTDGDVAVAEDAAEAATDEATGAEGAAPPDAEAQSGAATRSDAGSDAGSGSAASAAAEPAAPSPAPGVDEPSATTPHSETNVQVEGVDEPDIVKTDGDRILALTENRLHLASPAEGRVLDSVDLPEGVYGGEMLLAGDRALLVSSATGYAEPALPPDARRGPGGRAMPIPSTQVVQVDIQGDQLVVSDTVEVDGSYVSARMTDDVVRLVLHADPQQRLPFVTPANPNQQSESQARQLNQDVVEQAEPEELLPRWRRRNPDGGVADEGTLVGCEQAHAPTTFSGFGMVTVASIDLSEGLSQGVAAANGAGVMAGGETVYASPEHLYVAAPAWTDVNVWGRGSSGSGNGDEPADMPDGPAPVYQGTNIHRFDISDPKRAVYEMSGNVDGILLNQFAMDEHEGNLRVATTTDPTTVEGGGESDNHVVVLAPSDDGGLLQRIGAVSGLGRGETIHSVRFLGDVGYVVTFRQTDPLFTIDLSDATRPRVAGELHILGYSAYLHPAGDGRLIGVGQDATQSGRRLGTQVALFDVRDPAAPTRVAQATLPGASSQAESEHRAFLWWPDTGLVAIPVDTTDGRTPFSGIVGYRVDVEGRSITEIGRVAHPGDGGGDVPVPLPEPIPLPEPVPLPVEPDGGPGGGGSSGSGGSGRDADAIDIAPEVLPYPTPIQRSLVIGDRLWTVSSAGLASSDLTTLADTTFIPFP